MPSTIGQVEFGRTGRTISAIGLGTATFGREIDEDTSWRMMDYAVEHGITFFDTAEAYGGGIPSPGETIDENKKAERIIGDWMTQRGCRRDITICTKISGGRGGAKAIDEALKRSLDLLNTDRVEIYKMHSPDPNTPITETLGAMAEQVRAGRVEIIGCSNYSTMQMQEALDASKKHNYPIFQVTEPPYNLVNNQDEKELFPLCKREGVAITPHSPLGNGFLTGKYSPDRNNLPSGTRFDISPAHIDLYFHDRGWRVLGKLRAKSEELGIPMVKLAMAWCMAHPDVTAVLVGGRETRHIKNGIEAYTEGLDPDLRAEMSAWH